jgi:hypothetical protein
MGDLYNKDIVFWSERQAALLRQRADVRAGERRQSHVPEECTETLDELLADKL